MKMNKLEISVVLATRNRAFLLSKLLHSLAEQIHAPHFEVIVGDNGSSDDTAEVIERARCKLPVVCVPEDRPGKSRALNAALKHARGALLVFTDDDVQPRPDWLVQMHAASVRHTDCHIFGGRIDVDPATVPRWVRRSFNLMALLTSAHYLGDSAVRYRHGEYPFGPNMAVRRHLLKGIDAPYPENMGPGTSLPTGDESGFLMQFSPPGASDRLYVPTAVVAHEVEPQNVAFRTALNRCFLAGRAIGDLGLPPVPRIEPKAASPTQVALARIGSCRSFQELACITSRLLGYMSARSRMN